MGLFDKKYCDICGEKIGLLGNRKLENGNLCKNCAKKLSPWFSDRRNSTVEEIKAQLAYREENQGKVAAFHTTRTLGTDTKVLLDEDAGKFMVTRARDLQEANPDVLDFADVTGCNLDIDESRSELMREDKDGKEVSYNPPRYEYSYDFYITIFVNNPYFDEMRFRLNSSSVDITPPPALRPGMAGGYNPETNVEYRSCKRLGEEIRQALTQVRRDVREKIEQPPRPRRPSPAPTAARPPRRMPAAAANTAAARSAAEPEGAKAPAWLLGAEPSQKDQAAHHTSDTHLIFERRQHHGKLYRQHERGSIRNQSP
ncbi:MAG: DUF4428 domain-containing protein [Oscillospiraceae bacterium]